MPLVAKKRTNGNDFRCSDTIWIVRKEQDKGAQLNIHVGDQILAFDLQAFFRHALGEGRACCGVWHSSRGEQRPLSPELNHRGDRAGGEKCLAFLGDGERLEIGKIRARLFTWLSGKNFVEELVSLS